MKIEFLLPAEFEFENAIDYYNAKSKGLGFEFAEQVYEALDRIVCYPESSPAISSRLRRCQTNRFPYCLIYEIKNQSLVVVAVQHNHQKPKNWRERLH